jgi:mannose-6-phosphate isomerase-like protein (cupin superfamily)
MRVIRRDQFTGKQAWDALDIDRIDDATVRLHWTDQPYIWHINDGPEVFAVMDGEVDMMTRDGEGAERTTRLLTGDVFHAEAGDEHVAHPVGIARVLVIERAGSI